MRPERQAGPQKAETRQRSVFCRAGQRRSERIGLDVVDTGFGYSESLVRRRFLGARHDSRLVLLEGLPAHDQWIERGALSRIPYGRLSYMQRTYGRDVTLVVDARNPALAVARRLWWNHRRLHGATDSVVRAGLSNFAPPSAGGGPAI